MKVLIIPGFWDTPIKLETLSKYLSAMGNIVVTLDYTKYSEYGRIYNRHTSFKMIYELTKDLTSTDCVIAYSMGSSFLYDYLKHNKPKNFPKIIFIDPLMCSSSNYIKTAYLRVLDFFKSLKYYKNTDFPLFLMLKELHIALMQVIYNSRIKLDTKVNFNAIFLWGNLDLVCPISSYYIYSKYFGKSSLVAVKNHYHNWIEFEQPIKEYFSLELFKKIK